MSVTNTKSEIARLRKMITEEYEAMKHGLANLASGTAKHSFLQAKMRRADCYHSQLTHYVGEQEATHAVCEIYNQIMR